MTRLTSLAVALLGSALVAAPVPPDAKTLVAGLSDPDKKVRDEASAALKDRADALPWLRRAARSHDPITAARAAKLLALHEKRQEAVAKALDACIRDGHIDLLTEWHQYWQPDEEAKLWTVGPRAAKAGLDLFVKSCPKAAWERFEKQLAVPSKMKTLVHNGPCPERFETGQGAWVIRTDRLDRPALAPSYIGFASVGGPIQVPLSGYGGIYLALGPMQTRSIDCGFVACDGGISSENGVRTACSFVVCRGTFTGALVGNSVLLVDGDIDLTRAGDELANSLIRATGEIRLPKNDKPVNCTIQAHTKDATAPYKFFELSDVGLSLTPDQKQTAVANVKEDTPFGNCGIAKGDLIRAIDDVPAASPEDFRKHIRRALVRQGDCLVTVVRDGKTIDLAVFFPLPK